MCEGAQTRQNNSTDRHKKMLFSLAEGVWFGFYEQDDEQFNIQHLVHYYTNKTVCFGNELQLPYVRYIKFNHGLINVVNVELKI